MSKLQVLLVAATLVFTGAVSADHKSTHQVKERTAPMGKVYRAGDDVPVAAPPVVEASGPRDGVTVYTASCAMCHGAGVAGAPKLGDAAAWAGRVDKGLDTLVSNAINGIGAMPPKGGCATCSDEEIRLSVEHMLAELN